MKSQATIETASHQLYPLNLFYESANLIIPKWEILSGDAIPQPYRQLLVHNGDMTSTLQNYHRQKIYIEPIDFSHRDDKVLRQVVLYRDDGEPVEFGAIEIDLTCFPLLAQEDILASHLPLGSILHKFEIAYLSRPRAFFRIWSDKHIESVLNLPSGQVLFGRVNRLMTTDEKSLAHVVEILPPSGQ